MASQHHHAALGKSYGYYPDNPITLFTVCSALFIILVFLLGDTESGATRSYPVKPLALPLWHYPFSQQPSSLWRDPRGCPGREDVAPIHLPSVDSWRSGENAALQVIRRSPLSSLQPRPADTPVYHRSEIHLIISQVIATGKGSVTQKAAAKQRGCTGKQRES